jgi:hypothetical protein
MALETAEILNEVLRRLDRLERASRPARRGSTNQKGAAAYLNRSVEWLRQQHAAGRGPRRRKRAGSRLWDYSYEDLDLYREGEEAAD